jgi:uncharacterized protein (DUF1330 family)
MTVYALAQLNFTDRNAYDRYQERFMDVFKNFAGALLAADESPVVLEGDWAYSKAVLISFPDEKALRDWAESKAYREIARDRIAGASGPIIMLRGL